MINCQCFCQQICIPGLHISLGLFVKFYMLEEECVDLDVKMAHSKAEQATQLGNTELYEHVQSLQQARHHERMASEHSEEAQSISEYVTYLIIAAGREYSEDNRDPFTIVLLSHTERLQCKSLAEESINFNSNWKLENSLLIQNF